MSYRTYVEDVQIFGNNECYTTWIEFIKSQGIKVDEDYCYEGYIEDVDAAIKTIEQIVKSIYEWKLKSGVDICDLHHVLDKRDFTFELAGEVEYGYLFMAYNFYETIKSKVAYDLADDGCIKYRLVEDNKIHVYAR